MRGKSTCRKLAQHTPYTVGRHPNNTKPRHTNNMNENCYKNTEDSQNKKHLFIKGKIGVPPWNGQRQKPLGSGVKPVN